jgi:hypothetical protein
MNEHIDALEAELRGLRPHEPSPQLRQRIGERLDADARPVRRRWTLALAASLAAACVAAAVYLRRDEVQPNAVAPPQEAVVSAFDDSMPSAWVYRRAMRQSAEELNALLARHASSSPVSHSRLASVSVLMRSDTEFDSMLGDL